MGENKLDMFDGKRLVWLEYGNGKSSRKGSEKWTGARSWRYCKLRSGTWILSEVCGKPLKSGKQGGIQCDLYF